METKKPQRSVLGRKETWCAVHNGCCGVPPSRKWEQKLSIWRSFLGIYSNPIYTSSFKARLTTSDAIFQRFCMKV
ncbi:unnamed protein product [Allacma fusca]|uniref:Uncharacterized protein n=1 Tax=Allacma fusca TaxID=39272 RepID=A0A8J2JA04_9HEXA|nr:unnamed protein product [Allacma fusca]